MFFLIQEANESGALRLAKGKLEKQLEDLTWRLHLEKKIRVDVYGGFKLMCSVKLKLSLSVLAGYYYLFLDYIIFCSFLCPKDIWYVFIAYLGCQMVRAFAFMHLNSIYFCLVAIFFIWSCWNLFPPTSC